MSDGSSNFEMDGATYDGVTQPYMLEPETDADPNEETSVADHEPEIKAIRFGSNDWCRCGHCPAMSTEVESICCKEVDQVQVMMDAIPGDLSCITLHPGFDAVCLNIYDLQTAYLTFRQYHGQLTDDENKRNRYIAYRQAGVGLVDMFVTDSQHVLLHVSGMLSLHRTDSTMALNLNGKTTEHFLICMLIYD